MPSAKAVRRYIDMWALPGAHPTNLELLQQLKTADTHHFTKHMDVVGTVSEQSRKSSKWEKTHLVGVRTDVWRPDEQELAKSLEAIKRKREAELKDRVRKNGRLTAAQARRLGDAIANDDIMQMHTREIEKRRLVLKLFKTTGKRVRWCGTIEQVTATEVHNSIGSRRCLLTFVTMLPGREFVTYVQQNHRTFRVPSIFTFCYYEDGRMWHLSLNRHWVSLGADYDVEADGRKIGKLDGRLFCFGADSHVHLDSHPLASNTQFVDLITLFTASSGYHRAMRRSLKRRVKAAQSGQSHRHVIEDEELRLRQNSRAAA